MISDSLALRLSKLRTDEIDEKLRILSTNSVYNVRQILAGINNDFQAMILKITAINDKDEYRHLFLDYPKMNAEILDLQTDFSYLCDILTDWLDQVDSKQKK